MLGTREGGPRGLKWLHKVTCSRTTYASPRRRGMRVQASGFIPTQSGTLFWSCCVDKLSYSLMLPAKCPCQSAASCCYGPSRSSPCFFPFLLSLIVFFLFCDLTLAGQHHLPGNVASIEFQVFGLSIKSFDAVICLPFLF